MSNETPALPSAPKVKKSVALSGVVAGALLSCLAAVALSITSPHASATENTPAVARVEFSRADQSGTLHLEIFHADVRIVGSDAAGVEVRRQFFELDSATPTTDSPSYSLASSGNKAVLRFGHEHWEGGAARFEITVPRNTRITVATDSYDMKLSIAQLDSDLDLHFAGSALVLTDLSGNLTARIGTGDITATLPRIGTGDITATLPRIAAGATIALSSDNGNVALALPSNTAAQVNLLNKAGGIYSDFASTVLVAQAEMINAPKPVASGGGFLAGLTANSSVKIDREHEKKRQAVDRHRTAAEQTDPVGHASGAPDEIPLFNSLTPPERGGIAITGELNHGGHATIKLQSDWNGRVTLRQLPPQSH